MGGLLLLLIFAALIMLALVATVRLFVPYRSTVTGLAVWERLLLYFVLFYPVLSLLGNRLIGQ